ncbi:MAG: methyltransferase [Pseudoflavonifractor sp.]|nr:methyltransferase [Pseudoflavonifractor sp.]
MARNSDRETVFRFKRFSIVNELSAMKISTDGVLLGAWCDVSRDMSIIDAGAGTGLIALMAAQRSDATITAVEIDPVAATEASGNVTSSPWHSRITVVRGDFNRLASEGLLPKADHIISNPPYFKTTLQAPDRSRRLARHDCGFGYESLLRAAPSILAADNGRLSMISPADREDDILFDAEISHMHLRRLTRVSTVEGRAPSRILWEFSVLAGPVIDTALTIRDRDNAYTPQYRGLVNDFYINM